MSTSQDLTAITALLDAARAKAGSDYKVAKLLDRSSQEISDMRHGRLKAQPEDHALIAAIAGLDAEEALIRAVIAKHANKRKGEMLMSALGNVLARTGAGATLLSYGSAGLAMTLAATSEVAHALATMCTRQNRMATI